MQSITQKAFGGPEVLELTEVPRPQPLPTECRPRPRHQRKSGGDYIRAGAFPLLGEPPFTLGSDVSGLVEEVAPSA